MPGLPQLFQCVGDCLLKRHREAICPGRVEGIYTEGCSDGDGGALEIHAVCRSLTGRAQPVHSPKEAGRTL